MKQILLKSIPIVLLLLLSFSGGCGQGDAPGLNPSESIGNEFPHLEEASERLRCQAMEAQTGVHLSLPVFSILYDNMQEIPAYGEHLCNAMVEDCHHPEALLHHAFRLLGAPAGGYGPPIAITRKQAPSADFHFTAEGETSWGLLPKGLQAGIMEAVQGWQEASHVLEQFVTPLITDLNKPGRVNKAQYPELLMEPWTNKQLSNFTSIDLMDRADMRKLSFASRLMASSLSSLIALQPDGVPAGFETCTIETEMGRIGIFGPGLDTIRGTYGLIVDLGGDDLYLGSMASPFPGCAAISLVVDFGGDDTYRSGDGELVGGCLGIGMLFDLRGNDRYISEQAGIASACYGTSLLYDRQGDDSYLSSSAFSQGAAHMGAGLLVDLDGDDQYRSSSNSQGYGGTRGVAVLLDLAGHDRYNQDDPGSSFVQGAGRGRWAEATDGHSLGGGIGLFIDAGGSDHYNAESFSQGASYFAGMGLFYDLNGDDYYNASSHSQGYAAHFALAGFFEMKGDDQYNAQSDFGTITQILGGGRDQSAGWFIEAEGNDSYHFGNRSGGIGDLNGIGILWDRGGDDSYTWHQNGMNSGSPSLGQTVTLSEGMAMGSGPLSFPKDIQGGFFRDDSQSKLIIKKN